MSDELKRHQETADGINAVFGVGLVIGLKPGWAEHHPEAPGRFYAHLGCYKFDSMTSEDLAIYLSGIRAALWAVADQGRLQ